MMWWNFNNMIDKIFILNKNILNLINKNNNCKLINKKNIGQHLLTFIMAQLIKNVFFHDS